MAQVNIPQRKNELGSLMQVGGALAGGFAGGGLSGAATGASIGGLAGNTIENRPQVSPVGSQMDAMQRRTQDNLAILKQAEASLPELPEPVRQQYAAPIMQARMLEERKRGMV